MTPRLRWIPSAILLLFPLSTASADDPPSQKQNPPETPATFEPNSKPGAGQALLQKFEGEWTVAKVFYPRQGDPIRQTGTCSQQMIQDGRFLESRFTFGHGDSATTGTGLIGFDPSTSTFTSVWIDSRQTRMSIRHSQSPFDGHQIILFSHSLEPGPETPTLPHLSRLSPDATLLTHQQFALAPDGSERLMMELILTRKPTPAQPAPNSNRVTCPDPSRTVTWHPSDHTNPSSVFPPRLKPASTPPASTFP